MTWWWGMVRAAWARWDAWWARRAAGAVDADTVSWLDSLSTPEDHAAGPFDPVRVPGQRHRGRHARPSDFQEGT